MSPVRIGRPSSCSPVSSPLGGIYMFRWMLDTHAYARIALSGAFVVALLGTTSLWSMRKMSDLSFQRNAKTCMEVEQTRVG